MGRITIFSSTGCPHCKRVEAALQMRDIPFALIDVTKYPKRLADMVALCDRTTTPQVFFNTAHIGGADETLQVLQKWDDDLLLQSPRRKSSSTKSSGSSGGSGGGGYYTSPLHRYQVEIASNFDPVNPRFAIPQEHDEDEASKPEQAPEQQPLQHHAAAAAAAAESRTSSSSSAMKQHHGDGAGVITLPTKSGQQLSILEITETLQQILPRAENERRRVLYKKSFTKSEAIQAWSSHYDLSQSEAMEFGSSLQQWQILHAVPQQRGGGDRSGVKKHDFGESDSDDRLFRLQCDDQPHVLNSYRKWTSSNDDTSIDHKAAVASSSADANAAAATDDAMKLVNRLKDMVMEIEGHVTDNNGEIDYTKVQDFAVYTQFQDAVCELQTVNLALMKDDKTKNVFCMNMYNLMIKYAFMKLGAGRTSVSRHAFFSTVGFDIGGHFFSFQDFENGLLRGNRRAPYSMRRAQFSQRNDARRNLVIQNPDFRFHFGVNCGARSCPPVRIFSVDDLDNELAMVASAFCEDDAHVVIHEERNEIAVSKIFYWYKTDFVGNKNMNKQLPLVLVEYLRGTKKRTLEKMIASSSSIKVSFLPYDWTPNIKNAKSFNAADLKMDVLGFFGASTKTTSS